MCRMCRIALKLALEHPHTLAHEIAVLLTSMQESKDQSVSVLTVS
jgi:hypothetical protein